MALEEPVGYLYWYTTSVLLAVFTGVHVLIQVYHYASSIAPSYDPVIESHSPSSQTTAASSPTKSFADLKVRDGEKQEFAVRRIGRLQRALRAVGITLEKYIFLTSLPIPRWRWWMKRAAKRSIPTTEVGCTGLYLLGCLVLSFYGTAWDTRTYANQAGWLAVAQIPLIIALAGKNNLISFMTGISYEKLNFLHRAAGRVCLLCVWIHSGGYLYLRHGISDEMWRTSMTQWGFTGTVAFTLLMLLSIQWVRNKIYEFFLVAHICLAALTLAAMICHWKAVDVWIYPGIGLWAAERIFRALRLILLNKLWVQVPSPTANNIPSRATLTLLTPSTLMVSFPAPMPQLKWKAGQHFYVVMPAMSRLPWEAHPFTATTVPARPEFGATSGELTFIVRVRDGFTKRMKDAVDAERKARGLGVEEHVKIEVPAAVEGPYATVDSKKGFDGVLILAGGSGISYALSHLLQVIREAREGKTKVKRIRIIWMVKSRLHLSWVSNILLEHVADIPLSLDVSIHIHVTKHYFPQGAASSLPPSALLPTDPHGHPDNGWQEYLAKRVAEPSRRLSRLMSTLSWATWTGAHDRTAHSGPGTRRGSAAVLPVQAAKLTPAKKLPKPSHHADPKHAKAKSEDGNAKATVIPTFTWSEGYNEHDFVPAPRSERGPGRSRRLGSGVPSIEVTSEDEGEMSTQPVSRGRNPFEPVTPPSRSRQLSICLSPRMDMNGDRLPAALDPAHLPPSISSSRTTGANQMHFTRPITPPPAGGRARMTSISIEEPPIARRKSSVPSFVPSSPSLDVKPASPSIRRPSTLAISVVPEVEADGEADDENDTRPTLVAPPPAAVPMQKSTSASSIGGAGSNHLQLHAAPMAREGSAQSNLSILTTNSVLSTLGSGALTPALSEHGGGASFAQEAPQRRRQSVGLERLISWHEGRADLHQSVREMMEDIGKGGYLSVDACGPRSLLDSSRECVQSLTSVKQAWEGACCVEYHAETFGW